MQHEAARGFRSEVDLQDWVQVECRDEALDFAPQHYYFQAKWYSLLSDPLDFPPLEYLPLEYLSILHPCSPLLCQEIREY